jgi:hypothetical protein
MNDNSTDVVSAKQQAETNTPKADGEGICAPKDTTPAPTAPIVENITCYIPGRANLQPLNSSKNFTRT